MSYEPQIYLKSREPKDVNLPVFFMCVNCDSVENINGCHEHNGRIDILNLKVRGIPWSRKNQLASQCTHWEDNGGTIFDGDTYVRECLKFMIAEAPWGQTDDVFLSQIGDELGSALQNLIPPAFKNDKNKLKINEVKKKY